MPRMPDKRPLLPLAIAIVATSAITACAQTTPAAKAETPQLCLTGETVGFSCALRDGRLLSLCASAGFLDFKGNPTDNPSHAYVAVGAGPAQTRYRFPADPSRYQQHMYFWVSASGQPHLFVAAGPTPFLHFSLDIEAPVHVMSEATPADWPLAPSGNNALCAGQADRSQLDAFMSQMPDEADWRTRFSGQPGR